MAFWFLRGLRRGVVTTRYPAAVDAWAAALPSPPSFPEGGLERDLASRLVDACPNGSLWLEEADLAVDLGRCTACGRCVAAAPDLVRPSGRWELAARNRKSLLKRVAIREGTRGMVDR